MPFLIRDFLKNIFRHDPQSPRGVALFGTVQEVIRSKKFLEKEGFSVRLVAPPPAVRVGCDLAVEFDLIEQEAMESALKQAGYFPVRIVSTKEMLPDILREVAFSELDGFLMAKAGNMKVTIDKKDWKIVNISGGGCPDIPFVAEKLYQVRINEAEDPVKLGNSLCSFMLQIAFDALKEKVAR